MIVHGNATATVDIAVLIRIRTGLLLQLDMGPACSLSQSVGSVASGARGGKLPVVAGAIVKVWRRPSLHGSPG